MMNFVNIEYNHFSKGLWLIIEFCECRKIKWNAKLKTFEANYCLVSKEI